MGVAMVGRGEYDEAIIILNKALELRDELSSTNAPNTPNTNEISRDKILRYIKVAKIGINGDKIAKSNKKQH